MTKTRHTGARSLTNITLHMSKLILKPQGKQEFIYKVVGKLKRIHVEIETSNIQINNNLTYFPNMINMHIF